jgi:hypothetical protein
MAFRTRSPTETTCTWSDGRIRKNEIVYESDVAAGPLVGRAKSSQELILHSPGDPHVE